MDSIKIYLRNFVVKLIRGENTEKIRSIYQFPETSYIIIYFLDDIKNF